MTKETTLADDLKREGDLLRRRFVHATRPKGPLTMDQARDLCRRMDGVNAETRDEPNGRSGS